MKVYIGPYKNWIGPYQIAEKILFWKDKETDDSVHKFGTWLAEDKNGEDSWLTKICHWICSKQKRKINIKIDGYDTWGADTTLSLIIHPLLLKLKEFKQGSPMTEDEDVPENLRSNKAPPKEYEWDTDGSLHTRWDWILDEMIWAHDPEWEDKYDWKYPTEDIEDYKARQKRRQNGFRLFGKYYSGLWN